MASRTARSPRRSTELLSIVVSCVGGLCLLFGLAPVLVQGGIGLTLLGFALLASVGHIVVTARAGRSVVRAVIEVLAVAGLTVALVYGTVWYFTVYLAGQPGIMRFSSPPTTP